MPIYLAPLTLGPTSSSGATDCSEKLSFTHFGVCWETAPLLDFKRAVLRKRIFPSQLLCSLFGFGPLSDDIIRSSSSPTGRDRPQMALMRRDWDVSFTTGSRSIFSNIYFPDCEIMDHIKDEGV